MDTTLYLPGVLSDWVHLVDGDKDDQVPFRCLGRHFVSLDELRLQWAHTDTQTYMVSQVRL